MRCHKIKASICLNPERLAGFDHLLPARSLPCSSLSDRFAVNLDQGQKDETLDSRPAWLALRTDTEQTDATRRFSRWREQGPPAYCFLSPAKAVLPSFLPSVRVRCRYLKLMAGEGGSERASEQDMGQRLPFIFAPSFRAYVVPLGPFSRLASYSYVARCPPLFRARDRSVGKLARF